MTRWQSRTGLPPHHLDMFSVAERRLALNVFRISAIAILVLTAAAKLFSVGGDAVLLELPDPVFGLKYRHMMVLMGLAEILVAAMIFWLGNSQRSLVAIQGFSAAVLVYRVSVEMVGPGALCPCLGTLHEKLGLSEGAVEITTLSLLAYLLVGSIYFSLGHRKGAI